MKMRRSPNQRNHNVEDAAGVLKQVRELKEKVRGRNNVVNRLMSPAVGMCHCSGGVCSRVVALSAIAGVQN